MKAAAKQLIKVQAKGKRQFVPLVQVDLFHRLLGVLLFVYMLTSKLRIARCVFRVTGFSLFQAGILVIVIIIIFVLLGTGVSGGSKHRERSRLCRPGGG